jgi:hypothetical protein
MPPQTETPTDDPETEEPTGEEEPSGEEPEGSDGLMEGAEEDPESSEDELVDSLPDHMVDDDGEPNTQEVYKSYQGLVSEVDDTDVLAEDVINDDGTIDTETLIEQRNELRKIQSQSEDDAETDEDEEPSDTPESPENYELSDEQLDEYGIDPESQELDALKESAHESGLSNDQLETFIDNWMESATEVAEINREAELEKLHDDPAEAEKMVKEAVQWVKGQFNQGVLTEQEKNALIRMGDRAEGVRALQKLRNQIPGTEDIPTGTPVAEGEISKKEIEERMEKDDYQNGDPQAHEEVREMWDKYHEKRS